MKNRISHLCWRKTKNEKKQKKREKFELKKSENAEIYQRNSI